MLKEAVPGRFDVKCASCVRASPMVAGPLEQAIARLRELGWAEGFDGDWHCPVCTMRTTTRRTRFVPE